MTYLMHMDSPVGPLHLAADGQAITGLWLEGQKYFAATLEKDAQEGSLPVFDSARAWLEAYFAKEPLPPLPPTAGNARAVTRQPETSVRIAEVKSPNRNPLRTAGSAHAAPP